jgi:hypothetical protein
VARKVHANEFITESILSTKALEERNKLEAIALEEIELKKEFSENTGDIIPGKNSIFDKSYDAVRVLIKDYQNNQKLPEEEKEEKNQQMKREAIKDLERMELYIMQDNQKKPEKYKGKADEFLLFLEKN